MEILIIVVLWIVVLYIIKLNREIYEFRKYYNQHKEIYVPSYKEIVDNSMWYIQLFNLIKLQLRKKTSSTEYRKQLEENHSFAIANSEDPKR